MYALADINKFFASSIRMFMQELNGQPVIVLSNNDGCAICVSKEAERLGITMGANFFEVENIVKQYKINVFSTNFVLFADMSLRVKSLIRRYYERIEDYSIDEVFIDVGTDTSDNHVASCRELKRVIGQGLGLPISIGIANTLTLTKVACKFAKQYKGYEGVCIIDTDEKREKALKLLKVGSVWGIGEESEKKLNKIGVQTAWDFTKVPRGWVRKYLTITGEKTWRELQGESCIGLITEPLDKKSITVSRSFGKDVFNIDSVASALTAYSCMAAAKLREQHSVCKEILLFVSTNDYKKSAPQYHRNILIKLPVATNFDLEINEYVQSGLKLIYKSGYGIKKAGVILGDISSEKAILMNMNDRVDRVKLKNATFQVDFLNNKYGRNTVVIATQGYDGEWKIRQERKCPCFTTRSSDYPIAI